MTGFGYPEMLVDVTRRFASGDPAGGEDIFDLYLPLLRLEAQPGIGLALRKEIATSRCDQEQFRPFARSQAVA